VSSWTSSYAGRPASSESNGPLRLAGERAAAFVIDGLAGARAAEANAAEGAAPEAEVRGGLGLGECAAPALSMHEVATLDGRSCWWRRIDGAAVRMAGELALRATGRDGGGPQVTLRLLSKPPPACTAAAVAMYPNG